VSSWRLFVLEDRWLVSLLLSYLEDGERFDVPLGMRDGDGDLEEEGER
jgi:hypothetical protein